MEQIYVIKVRSGPPPLSQVLPSERRYSALSVLGISSVHLALCILVIVFTVLRAHESTSRHLYFWPLTLVPVTSLAAGVTGLLAWRRWYQGVHIRVFMAASSLSWGVTTAVTIADVLTVPVLVPTVFHTVLACTLQAIWSAVSTFVAWRGMINKYKDEVTPATASGPGWDVIARRESHAKVMHYLNGHRPPVEGKEKASEE